jgi:hypothetical protein
MARKTQPVVVDESDVDRYVEFVVQESDFADTTPERRADLAYKTALNHARLQKHTEPWALELARKVRNRVLWAKPPNAR